MRSAPPVQVPVGRFVWGGYAAVALAALSMGTFVWAWIDSGVSLAKGLTGLLVWVCVAFLSWWQLGRQMLLPGDLAWDGGVWRHAPCEGTAVQVDLAVVWDVQVAMLVRVKAVHGEWHGPRYAWLRAVNAPALWHSWRCAVFGRDIL